jgi:hypothetical protein
MWFWVFGNPGVTLSLLGSLQISFGGFIADSCKKACLPVELMFSE